jgi:serine protease
MLMRATTAAAILLGLTGITAWSWRGVSPHPGGSPPADELLAAERASPTTLIVDFRDDITDQELASRGYVDEPISRFSVSDRMYRIRFRTPQDAQDAARRLRMDPMVESVDYDTPVSLFPEDWTPAAPPVDAPECASDDRSGEAGTGFPNDPCFRYQWHMRQVGLPAAWKLGQGRGVVVAVIDTGVTRVPDLQGTRFVPGFNFVADNDKTDDDHGHGTHVAGTIAQSTNNRRGVAGIAFRAAIMPLKVLSSRGAGSMAAIAQAIRFAADHDANVINLSLGGPFPVTPVRRAIEYAHRKGVVVVAAAGNDGRGRVSYPARYPDVIAVAATQWDETTTFYSNWGKEIDIAAPGGNTRVDQNGDGKPDGILQNTVLPGAAQDGYLWFMGTSMAAPHVAGIAALVVGAGVTRPDAVQAVLVDTARKPKPVSSAGGRRIDDHYGAGIADAQAALQKARGSRGVASLGLATALGLLGLGGMRRREKLGGARAWGFAGALVLGASGLFFLPSLPTPAWLADSPIGTGALESLAFLLGPASQGNPLLWSALFPFGAVALLYSVGSLRPALAGLAFGVAGGLLFAACAYPADVRFVPDVLDRAWLTANAVLATGLGALVLRK